MNKYRVIVGHYEDVDLEINSLVEQYSPQQITGVMPRWPGDSPAEVAVLLRARSEEPDPADDWCIGQDSKGNRCLNDAVRDGYCKRHWREAATRGDVGGAG